MTEKEKNDNNKQRKRETHNHQKALMYQQSINFILSFWHKSVVTTIAMMKSSVWSIVMRH
jgi:hypothetical protein